MFRLTTIHLRGVWCGCLDTEKKPLMTDHEQLYVALEVHLGGVVQGLAVSKNLKRKNVKEN